MFGAWFLIIEQLGGMGTTAWHTVWAIDGLRLSLARFWDHFVAIPLVQFFMLRWIWRLAIWTLFLREVSQLRLNLIATHSEFGRTGRFSQRA